MAVDSATVTLPRALAEQALASLRAAETTAGHLAQKVGHEHLGLCSWRGCGEPCTRHRALVAELGAALEGRADG